MLRAICLSSPSSSLLKLRMSLKVRPSGSWPLLSTSSAAWKANFCPLWPRP